MTNAIKSQKIVYAKDEILESGKKYVGNNGSEVIVASFYEDYDGALMISYSAKNPDLHEGWARGDTTPNTMYHWIFPNGRYSGNYKPAA